MLEDRSSREGASKGVGIGISWGKLTASNIIFLYYLLLFALSLVQKLGSDRECKAIIQILP